MSLRQVDTNTVVQMGCNLANLQSRCEIKPFGKGTYAVLVICEKTKSMTPCFGVDKRGATMLAQLLVDLGKQGIELPKEIVWVDQ